MNGNPKIHRHASPSLSKKLLCAILSASMATFGICPAAFAQPSGSEETPEKSPTSLYGEIESPTTVQFHDRDCTFVDIDDGKTEGRTPTSDQEQLYKAAVMKVLPGWASLGYNIMGYAAGGDSKHFTFWDNAGKGWQKDFGEGHYIRYYDGLTGGNGATSSGDDRSSQSGICLTNSLASVYERTTDDLAALLHHKLKGADFRDNVPMTALTDNTAEQPVIYANIQQIDRAGKTYHYYYNSFGIAFHDFKVHQLNTGKACPAAPDGDPEYDADSTETTDVFTSSSINYGYDDSEVSVSLSNGTSESLGTTVSNSEEYTFGDSIGIDVSVSESVDIPAVGSSEFGFSYSAGISASEAFSTAYSEEKTIETNNCQTTTVTTTLPAHTVACATQKLGTSHLYESYDQPVGITFKVSIFGINGEFYDDNAAVQDMTSSSYAHNSFCTTFGEDGSDAMESLYQRAVVNRNDRSYDQTHGQNVSWSSNGNKHEVKAIDWNEVLGNRTPPSRDGSSLNLSQKVSEVASTYPMSALGAKICFDSKSVETSVPVATPIYPIKHISVDYQVDRTKKLEVGEEFAIQSYRVQALDQDYVPYYGFVPSQGTWEVVDSSGKKYESDVIEVQRDSVTKEQSVVALKPGTAYVKYFIPENTYVDAYGNVSTNDDIDSAAYKIQVLDEEIPAFEGSIKVEGNPQVTVDEQANLNNLDGLSLSVFDKTGKEVDQDVKWEAQELEKKGIRVDADGTVICSKEGTFHVRAFADDVRSEWVELAAVAPAAAGGEGEVAAGGSESAAGQPAPQLSDAERQSLLGIAGDVYSYGTEHGYITGDSKENMSQEDFCAMYVIYEIALAKGLVSDEDAKAVKEYVHSAYSNKQIDEFKQQAFAIMLEKGYIPQGVTTTSNTLDVDAWAAELAKKASGKSAKNSKSGK